MDVEALHAPPPFSFLPSHPQRVQGPFYVYHRVDGDRRLAMELIHSFAPIVDGAARVLVLGSMPGRASLAAGQYYAHPRNAFWPIMAELLHVDATAAYAVRVRALQAAGIAVWDVLQSCARTGSLDADIRPDSLTVNDFATFFQRHPGVVRVFFNGGAAAASFRRLVLPELSLAGVEFRQLPSTSPAHAARSLAEKMAAWQVVVETARLAPATR